CARSGDGYYVYFDVW
nr:immunoglobulin heavy chain junction region [Mus musculus]